MNRRLITYFVLSLSILCVFSTAHSYPKTAAEFAKLPPYCKARFAEGTSAGYLRGKKVFGTAWTHMHHYCAGLNLANNAKYEADKSGQAKMYRKAIKQFQYMEENTPASWFLRAEIATQKGKAAIGLGDYVLAYNSFTQAIQLKPDYVAAYSGLGKVYIAQGDYDKARQTYEAGLQQKPESKLLKRRLKELAGRKRPAKKDTGKKDVEETDVKEQPGNAQDTPAAE